MLIGVPLTAAEANTQCSDSPLVQQYLGYPSCTTKGALEGLGIVLSIVGFVVLAVGLVGNGAGQIGTPPATIPSQIQSGIACKTCGRVYMVGQFTYCPNCGQKL